MSYHEEPHKYEILECRKCGIGRHTDGCCDNCGAEYDYENAALCRADEAYGRRNDK